MSTHLLVIGAWHHAHKNTVSFDNKKQTGHLHQILTAQQKGHIYTNPSRPVVYSVSYLHLTQDVDFNENMLMHRNMLVDNLRVFVAYQPDVAASTSHTWCTLHQPTFHFAFFCSPPPSSFLSLSPSPKRKRHTNRISTQTQTSFAKIIKWSYC